jgi:hypothetical protein
MGRTAHLFGAADRCLAEFVHDSGPGASVLCYMPVAIKQHVECITGCIAHKRHRAFERIEATPEAVDRGSSTSTRRHKDEDARLSGHMGTQAPGMSGLRRQRGVCRLGHDMPCSGRQRAAVVGRT